MDVTLFGMFMDVKPLQYSKAHWPIVFTLFGMVIDVKLLQRLKAEAPMLVTLLGILVVEHPIYSVLVAVSIMALQLSRES